METTNQDIQETSEVDAIEICARLPEEAFQYAKIVGAWVWVTFPEKPCAETLGKMKELGFHWNKKRLCWQHNCGVKRKMLRNGNPIEKYGETFVAQLLAE